MDPDGEHRLLRFAAPVGGLWFGNGRGDGLWRPVIATGWSGNVDFTRPDNALLVDYDLVPLERDLGPYRRGQMWAEPDLEAAANCMRQIAVSATLRQKLGNRGKRTVANELSPAALAPLMRNRLGLIGNWALHDPRD